MSRPPAPDDFTIEARGTPRPDRSPAARGTDNPLVADATDPRQHKPKDVLDAPKVTTVELGFIGSFTSNYESAQERAAIQRGGGWYPDTVDFRKAMTQSRSFTPQPLSTIGELMTRLLKLQDHSIRRLDILTHGNATAVGFKGSIEVGRGRRPSHLNFADARADLLTNPSLDAATLVKLTSDPDDGPRFAAIRRKFSRTAEIHIYACNAGTSAGLVDAIAKAFGAKTFAFTLDMGYTRVKDLFTFHLRRQRIEADGRVGSELLGLETDYRGLDAIAAAAGVQTIGNKP